jgi:hypothetical protein
MMSSRCRRVIHVEFELPREGAREKPQRVDAQECRGLFAPFGPGEEGGSVARWQALDRLRMF